MWVKKMSITKVVTPLMRANNDRISMNIFFHYVWNLSTFQMIIYTFDNFELSADKVSFSS